MDDELKRRLVKAQRNEITEYHVYQRLARRETNPHNRDVLRRIGQEEKRHYDFWAERTGRHPAPRRRRVWKYVALARLLGLTFAAKLMERGEQKAEANYEDITRSLPEAREVMADEQRHENELTALIDEERLRYMGSVVLGLSDALVELTGALAGLTLALRHAPLIALTGSITGIAAAMSMAASEYLSTKADEDEKKSPLKAALYTGLAYILTVGVLVLPFIVLAEAIAALGITLAAALLVILGFAFYSAVARDLPLGRRFGEMAGLSLGVAAVSFGIGYLLRVLVGIDV